MTALRWVELPDKTGSTMVEHAGTWPEMLAHLAAAGPFQTKDSCPWFKFGQFGQKRSAKGSLRTNENLTVIHGIEADYDGGAVTVAQAAGLLELYDLKAALYPSPSSTESKPRWRVVLPLSEAHPPAARSELVARVNGVLGGILAPESFTLSQGYYYGATPSNAYAVTPTFNDPAQGEYLDQVPGLSDIALGKRALALMETAVDATKPVADDFLDHVVDASDPVTAIRLAVERKGELLTTGDERRDLLRAFIGKLSANGVPEAMVRPMVEMVVEKYFDPADPIDLSNIGAIASTFAKADAKVRAERGPLSVTDLCDFDDLTEPGKAFSEIEKPELALTVVAKSIADRFDFSPVRAGRNRKHPGWIMKKVIPRGDVGAIVGASGSGKSFLVLDMLMAVARGIDWCGRKTAQGAVAYVCAEGAAAFYTRVQAYCDYHGVDVETLPFYILDAAPNLLEKDDVKALVSSLRKLPPLTMLVVDTLAQVTPGADENSGKDMGRALAHCKALAKALRTLTILVHHTGKDLARGARGWSGLNAALDFCIMVERSGDHRAATVSKMKDGGGEGDEFGFTLVSQTIGEPDEDGELETSCVLKFNASAGVLGAQKMVRESEPKGGKVQKVVLEVMADLTVMFERVALDTLVENSVAQIVEPKDAQGKDRRKEHVKQAIVALVKAGKLTESGLGLELP